jgi:hypothetical protein
MNKLSQQLSPISPRERRDSIPTNMFNMRSSIATYLPTKILGNYEPSRQKAMKKRPSYEYVERVNARTWVVSAPLIKGSLILNRREKEHRIGEG